MLKIDTILHIGFFMHSRGLNLRTHVGRYRLGSSEMLKTVMFKVGESQYLEPDHLEMNVFLLVNLITKTHFQTPLSIESIHSHLFSRSFFQVLLKAWLAGQVYGITVSTKVPFPGTFSFHSRVPLAGLVTASAGSISLHLGAGKHQLCYCVQKLKNFNCNKSYDSIFPTL